MTEQNSRDPGVKKLFPSKIQNAKVLIIHCNDQRQAGSSALMLSFI